MISDKHTFFYDRYIYNSTINKWTKTESGSFSSRSKTSKGVCKALIKAVPHINKKTDLVLFHGQYFYDKDNNHFIRGVWCPLKEVLEGYDCDIKEVFPQDYINVRNQCIQYIEYYNK